MEPTSNHYLTAAQVRAYFGGISQMSLWRWLNDEKLEFPKPLIVNKRRLFPVAEIEAWAVRRRATAAQPDAQVA